MKEFQSMPFAEQPRKTAAPETLENKSVNVETETPAGFENAIDLTHGLRYGKLRELHKIACERKIYSGSYDDFNESFRDGIFGLSSRHLSGLIEEEIINIGVTFGSCEVSYFKSLGKEEILRLRNLEMPKMLLVGSLGKYSALDFSKFAKKINKNSRPNVIDLEKDYIKYFKEIQRQNDLQIAIADASKMPYNDDTFDFVATNFLLHAFESGNSRAQMEDIVVLLKEVRRVLKPEGKFVLNERRFGRLEQAGSDGEILRAVLVKMAKEAGFVVDSAEKGYKYVFRTDNLCADIDHEGNVKYGDATIGYDNDDALVRLSK
ncbi:MAG: hypothetical protein ACD_9C00104G0005 [uncultured bacterium]|nr:MAG: hypothetical protein ACD_9C00104G0005 [uncultured bacterium]